MRSFELPRGGRVIIGPAPNFRLLCEAYRLVYERFLAAGYVNPSAHRMQYGIGDLFSTSTTLVAIADRHVVGTATIAAANVETELPSQRLYPGEMRALAERGRKLAESSKFACAKAPSTMERGLGTMSLVATELLRELFLWCVAERVDDWMIVVHPRVSSFYRDFLGFEQIGPERACPRVNDSPGVLLNIDVRGLMDGTRMPTANAAELFIRPASAVSARDTGHRPAEFETALFLLDNPALLESASDRELKRLAAEFPGVPVAALRQLGAGLKALSERPSLVEMLFREGEQHHLVHRGVPRIEFGTGGDDECLGACRRTIFELRRPGAAQEA